MSMPWILVLTVTSSFLMLQVPSSIDGSLSPSQRSRYIMSINRLSFHGSSHIMHVCTFPCRRPNYSLVFLSSIIKRRRTASSLQPFNSMKVLIHNIIIIGIVEDYIACCYYTSSAACSGVCWSGLSCHASLHRRGDRGQGSEGVPRNSDKGLLN